MALIMNGSLLGCSAMYYEDSIKLYGPTIQETVRFKLKRCICSATLVASIRECRLLMPPYKQHKTGGRTGTGMGIKTFNYLWKPGDLWKTEALSLISIQEAHNSDMRRTSFRLSFDVCFVQFYQIL